MSEKEKVALYHHLFTETLFIFPEDIKGDLPLVAPAAVEVKDMNLGNTLPVQKYTLVGDNRKGLIIAVSLPDPEFANLPQNTFLTKLLAAIQHKTVDVGYVNLQRGEKLDIFELAKTATVKNVIAFGPGLVYMSSDSKVSLYKPASIGTVGLLITDPVAEIELDVNKKKWLWSGLQAIFLK